MKKLFISLSAILTFALIAFNYSLGDHSLASDKHNQIRLDNIKALQAYAQVEYYCNESSSSTCTITLSGNPGGVLYGTGQPVIKF
ncbi:MAG TPA: hypothetical protein VL832_04300 [Puia sp.]|nr:hypothetical protein [Puia sp.]